jgi:Dolichyl-phosphate-mannose-protein mannosyltransferase
MTRDDRPRFDYWLLLILALGLALRCLYFSAPYGDAHRWRQIENLSVAWIFESGSLNPFYPQAIWGGLRDGYVEMEFPLVPFVLAVAWRLFGESDAFGRLIGIASSLVLIAAIYELGRELFGRAVGRGAALLLAVSPSAVFFGRVPMTDTPMIACSTLAILGYAKYFASGSTRWGTIGAAAAAVAWLSKIPSVLILGPIAILALQARGWRFWRDRMFVIGLAAAALVTAAWYVHAWQLYASTGWTVGIWRPFGQYPAAIAARSGPAGAFSLWSTAELLRDSEFWSRLLERTWYIHLTPIGLAGVLLGLLRACHLRRGLVALTWFAAAVTFVIVVGHGNFWHEYYQLPVLPPAALLFGLAAAPVFGARVKDDGVEGAAIVTRTPLWQDRLEGVVKPLIVVGLAVLSFYFSGIIRNFFRPETLDHLSVESGAAMANHIPPGDGVIVVEYEQGTNSPVLLYFLRHRGWSFDMKTITPAVIDYLKTQGATHFATTDFLLLEDKRPDIIEYLRRSREIPLGQKIPPEARLFELH